MKERLFNYATDTQQMVFELRLDNLLNELVGACVNGKTGTCLEFKDKTRCVKVQEIDNLLYVIRTNMTSITRYVRHNKEDHPTLTAGQFLDQHLKYKELAEIAVNNILEYINGN